MSSDLKFHRNVLWRGLIIKLNILEKFKDLLPDELLLISIPPTEYSVYIINNIVTIKIIQIKFI